MRPDRDLGFAPAEADIGMVALLFRQCADPIDEREAFAKVPERIGFLQVMFIDGLPPFQLLQQLFDLRTGQRGHTTLARYALWLSGLIDFGSDYHTLCPSLD